MHKLTANTKWGIKNGVTVIYARKSGSNKWEEAFTCHFRTIDLIKNNGFQFAVSRNLLTPAKTEG